MRGVHFVIHEDIGVGLWQPALAHAVELHDGEIEDEVNVYANYLVATHEHLNPETPTVRKAEEFGIPIVTPDFLKQTFIKGHWPDLRRYDPRDHEDITPYQRPLPQWLRWFCDDYTFSLQYPRTLEEEDSSSDSEISGDEEASDEEEAVIKEESVGEEEAVDEEEVVSEEGEVSEEDASDEEEATGNKRKRDDSSADEEQTESQKRQRVTSDTSSQVLPPHPSRVPSPSGGEPVLPEQPRQGIAAASSPNSLFGEPASHLSTLFSSDPQSSQQEHESGSHPDSDGSLFGKPSPGPMKSD
ncbi:hypothetical protein F4805DRAFT_458087 [Annulohypoxylon moriforme]|nr:hypothetical protein F4805DRAFT_458087 [Annulohypoxylon moriforme]